MSLVAIRRAKEAAANQATGIHKDLTELFSDDGITRDIIVDVLADCDLADLKTYALTLGIKVQKKSSKALVKQIGDWFDTKWSNLNVQPTAPQSLEYIEFVIPTNLVNPDDVGVLRETADTPSTYIAKKSTANVKAGDVCLCIKVGNGETFDKGTRKAIKSSTQITYNLSKGCLTIKGNTKTEERFDWLTSGDVASYVERAIQSLGDRLTDNLASLREHGYDS